MECTLCKTKQSKTTEIRIFPLADHVLLPFCQACYDDKAEWIFSGNTGWDTLGIPRTFRINWYQCYPENGRQFPTGGRQRYRGRIKITNIDTVNALWEAVRILGKRQHNIRDHINFSNDNSELQRLLSNESMLNGYGIAEPRELSHIRLNATFGYGFDIILKIV